ncbi:MAG TPA: aminopeptidase N [Micromonosporaceae bacterium]|nr:aminopeptidase N [Micromonosporaceae bacterium]
MPSLTRAAALERAASIHVDSYEIDLDLTRGAERFDSVTTITFGATEPGLTTFLDVRPALLRSATLNGVPLDPASLRDGRLPLPNLAAHNEVVVDAEMAYTNNGQGLHRFVDPADGRTYVYAASFLDQAPSIFGCFDQPDLKAPVSVTVAVDPTWMVAGNGVAAETRPGQWVLATTPPLATYFVTVVAGPYHAVRDQHDGIPLALYARTSIAAALQAQAGEIFALTRACLDRYHELFGVRYPFGAYQQAFVPEFTMGAMENPGCVTFRDEYVFSSAVTDAEREQRALVIAHEMAHMWFGDLVTMRWWDDLWLNESFAEYLGHRVAVECTEFTNAWTTFAIGTKAWGYAADQRPSTHPVSADVVDTDEALLNFDGISYAKGAAVLRQLAAVIGDEAFLTGLRTYFGVHAYGNATLDDLLVALGDASGRDLHEWARLWLRTVGVSTLRLSATRTVTDEYAEVVLTQESPHAMRPHRLRIGSYRRDESGVTTRRDSVDVDIEPGNHGGTVITALAGRPATDLLLVNDDDLTYARVRLEPADLDRLAEVLPSVGDPLARALLWMVAWDVTRDAEWDALRFVDLCAAELPRESDVAVFGEVLGYARDVAVDRFVPPDLADAARRSLAHACRLAFDVAGDARDSGKQLAAVRGMITCAGPDDVTWLRRWLTDPVAFDERGPHAEPPGRPLDTELRWLIAGRLATLGTFDEADIDGELARDRTAITSQHAVRARASRPEPAVKAAVWERLIHDDTLSNRVLFANARGFWQPGQVSLTASYVDRYVAEMPAMAARRSAQVAERVARFAFPAYAIDAGSLALMTRMRDDESLVPALRRALIDETDELARSVAARDLAAKLQQARDDERTVT